ncbi:hypothetical protein DND90_31850 [Pseudomonas syringae pv. maculicola]|nr:hypothetical protein DND90_31850 [Pseudomonas syringae pv. maculicola]
MTWSYAPRLLFSKKMLFDHAISPKHLYGLNGLICQPEKVFKSKTRPETSVVVMTIETLRELPIVVPIGVASENGF